RARRAGVPGVHRPAYAPPAVRACPERAQRDRARAATAGQPRVRGGPGWGRADRRDAQTDRGAGHPQEQRVRRGRPHGAGAASSVTSSASERRTARPVILGVVGDSAAGKTTITRGLVRVLGEEHVAHICTDDYHRYDRRQRAELGITPLHPDCNHVEIIAQHLAHLRQGEPILKPVYRHQDGTFGPPVYVRPERFTVIEGLFGYYLPEMCDVYDVRVFLNPPEQLRR